MNENKRIAVLRKAAASKLETTLQRVTNSVKVMEESGISINFKSVAKYAGVSKTSIYANEALRALIIKLRGRSEKVQRSFDEQTMIKNKDIKIKSLNKKIKILEHNINQLKIQLEIVYGELYKKNSGSE